MKSTLLLLIVLLINVAYSFGACPEGEYYPGPKCDDINYREPEPSCPPKGPHYRPNFRCCWCNPGTFRLDSSEKCVKLDDC